MSSEKQLKVNNFLTIELALGIIFDTVVKNKSYEFF